MKALALALLLGAAWLPGAAFATSGAEQVRVSQAWLRILPGALPAAGYAVLENTGEQAVALTGAHSAVYTEVMLHQSSAAGGTNRMSMVEAMPVPAHGQAQLAPGGYHLMLSRPTQPVVPGNHVPLTLSFADGSTLTVDFLARPANATGAGTEPSSHAAHPAPTPRRAGQ